MVALLVWGALLVHLYNHHRCNRPEPTTAKLYCNLVGLTNKTMQCLLLSPLYLSWLKVGF